MTQHINRPSYEQAVVHWDMLTAVSDHPQHRGTCEGLAYTNGMVLQIDACKHMAEIANAQEVADSN